MSITDFNTPQFTFNIPDEFEFAKLADLDPTKQHRVNILYINDNSDFEDAPVAVTDEALVNLPAHLTKTVQQILSDQDLIDQINSGTIGFTVREYKNKYGKQHTVTWIDTLEPRSSE